MNLPNPLNVVSNSEHRTAKLLSNLARTPFSIIWPGYVKDGQSFIETVSGVEGPLQAIRFGIKFELQTDNFPQRSAIAQLHGRKARNISDIGSRDTVHLVPFSLTSDIDQTPDGFIYDTGYRGVFPQVCPFGGEQHREFIRWLLWSKFFGNKEAREALISTVGIRLIHDTGELEKTNTSLPASEFCHILENIRTVLTTPGLIKKLRELSEMSMP